MNSDSQGAAAPDQTRVPRPSNDWRQQSIPAQRRGVPQTLQAQVAPPLVRNIEVPHGGDRVRRVRPAAFGGPHATGCHCRRRPTAASDTCRLPPRQRSGARSAASGAAPLVVAARGNVSLDHTAATAPKAPSTVADVALGGEPVALVEGQTTWAHQVARGPTGKPRQHAATAPPGPAGETQKHQHAVQARTMPPAATLWRLPSRGGVNLVRTARAPRVAPQVELRHGWRAHGQPPPPGAANHEAGRRGSAHAPRPTAAPRRAPPPASNASALHAGPPMRSAEAVGTAATQHRSTRRHDTTTGPRASVETSEHHGEKRRPQEPRRERKGRIQVRGRGATTGCRRPQRPLPPRRPPPLLPAPRGLRR